MAAVRDLLFQNTATTHGTEEGPGRALFFSKLASGSSHSSRQLQQNKSAKVCGRVPTLHVLATRFFYIMSSEIHWR